MRLFLIFLSLIISAVLASGCGGSGDRKARVKVSDNAKLTDEQKKAAADKAAADKAAANKAATDKAAADKAAADKAAADKAATDKAAADKAITGEDSTIADNKLTEGTDAGQLDNIISDKAISVDTQLRGEKMQNVEAGTYLLAQADFKIHDEKTGATLDSELTLNKSGKKSNKTLNDDDGDVLQINEQDDLTLIGLSKLVVPMKLKVGSNNNFIAVEKLLFTLNATSAHPLTKAPVGTRNGMYSLVDHILSIKAGINSGNEKDVFINDTYVLPPYEQTNGNVFHIEIEIESSPLRILMRNTIKAKDGTTLRTETTLLTYKVAE